mgnify:CR=1 FL=1
MNNQEFIYLDKEGYEEYKNSIDNLLINLGRTVEKMNILKETNFEDKIKLSASEKSEYDSLYQHFIKVQRNIQEYTSQIKTIVEKILVARKARTHLLMCLALQILMLLMHSNPQGHL